MKRQIKALLESLGLHNPCAAYLGIKEVRRTDGFLVSFPRSGNTWMRFMLANLIHPDRDIYYSDLAKYVPDLHKSAYIIDELKSRRVIKSHYGHFSCYPRFVYIVRDGRDAIVSYYQYCLGANKFKGSFSEFLQSPRPRIFGTWNWAEHVKGALDRLEASPMSGVLIKYEQMLQKPELALETAAATLGIEVDKCKLEQAVESSTFIKLKDRGRNDELLNNENKQFFRKGIQGDWKQWFSTEDEEMFLRDNAPILERLGYL